jgi:hypothetical protein
VSEELWSHINVKAGEEVCFIDMFDKLEICAKSFYDRQKEDEGSLADIDLSKFDVKGL